MRRIGEHSTKCDGYCSSSGICIYPEDWEDWEDLEELEESDYEMERRVKYTLGNLPPIPRKVTYEPKVMVLRMKPAARRA